MSAASVSVGRRLDGAGGGAGGDSTPGSDGGGERITRLFPKCRPRARRAVSAAGMQHHRDRSSSAVESRHNDINNINNLSSDEERTRDNVDSNQMLILNSKGGTYKLRDSRIIEVAGGRELYSQSRSKALRKLRHSNAAHKHALRNSKARAARLDPAAGDYADSFHPDNIIQRIANHDMTKKMVSKQTSPTYVNGGRPHKHPSRNNGTASPDASPAEEPARAESQKGSPIAVVADGQVVVLDDISEDWKGLRLNLDSSDVECEGGSGRSAERSPRGDEEGDEEGEEVEAQQRLTRVIGELPIAEYEGSPRRYGVGAPPPARSPRPGFPQRVIEDSGDEGTRPSSSTAFDYLYEFSETRKVLEEFFRCPVGAGHAQLPSGAAEEIVNFQELEYSLVRQQHACSPLSPASPSPAPAPAPAPAAPAPEVEERSPDASWRARRAAPRRLRDLDSPLTHNHTNFLGLQQNEPYERELNVVELSVGTDSGGSGSAGAGAGGSAGVGGLDPRPPHFALSPDTTDCDSNCGDLDSELSLIIMENEIMEMKGLSESGRGGGAAERVSMPLVEDGLSSGHASDTDNNNLQAPPLTQTRATTVAPGAATAAGAEEEEEEEADSGTVADPHLLSHGDLHSLDPLGTAASSEVSPPPPAPAPHRPPHEPPASAPASHLHPLWLPGKRANSAASTESVDRKPTSGDEDEADTDLETDRLLGQQRTDDQGFFDDKGWRKPKSRTVMPAGAAAAGGAGAAGGGGSSGASAAARSPPHPPADPDHAAIQLTATKDKDGKKKGKNKEGDTHTASVLIEGVLFRARYLGSTQLACEGQPTKATRMLQAEEAVSRIKWSVPACGEEEAAGAAGAAEAGGGAYSGVYAAPAPAAVFRLSFLGSVEVDEDGPVRRRKKRLKKNMVEEAVTKIKAPEGENQPSTEVDLFISTEKIMVLNTELKEIMMDHALRTISYIADIGELVVLMARRRFVPHDSDSDPPKLHRTPKMICHVFESEEAQFIAQSIGQAFQVAYMEFLKANGIEDHSFVKEMDYQEVLNSQEIFGDELQMFAKKELQKEVVVPKTKGEILGVVVVESGWGSMLPTVVIANLAPAGAAARCGHLNIGDQIIAINGVSLVGLPLSTCQTYIKNSKNQTVVKLTVVPCPPVVEVKIKRPDTKYQLGFSVQNGVICSLLRGGIAERGGVRVGHRIIEINSQSVVAVPHERIVNLLATSVGEILMKTMPTSMFRLLTGQENPIYI